MVVAVPMSTSQSVRDTPAGRRHLDGVSDLAIGRARDGTNRHCVDCDGEPMGGGLRCPDCFFALARPAPRGHGSLAGYRAHYRRGEHPCLACRNAKSVDKAERKA